MFNDNCFRAFVCFVCFVSNVSLFLSTINNKHYKN